MNVSSNFLAQILYKQQKPKASVKVEEFSVFESFFIESFDRVIRNVKDFNLKDFVPINLDSSFNATSKGFYLVAQYFLFYDVLNEHPLNNLEEKLTDELVAYQSSTLVIMFAVMLSAIFLSFVLGCIQIILIRNLTKKI